MASRGAGLPYRQLLQSSARTPWPRRTISYSRPLRVDNKNTKEVSETAKEDETAETKSKRGQSGFLASMREMLFSGKKPSEAPKWKPKKTAPIERTGSLGEGSIFDDGAVHESDEADLAGKESQTETPRRLEDRLLSNMQMVIDPNPKARERWQRKMVIREIRKRGRLTKQEIILATERDSLLKSHWFKTSVKKLGPLARQIAGKNIDEAILQMRFSKKKVAKDVMEHLKLAKNTAIVRHGMGLAKTGEKAEPITIVLKDGEKKVITDPTSIYIAEAWVNRGPFDTEFDHRARGRINVMRLPYTALSVRLKEEKTRIREWKDRETRAKRQRKSMLWTQLPDRPISAQNQYYSW